ncbi:MAG: hypothetical protein WDN69_11150 [Aliidongia sp.]
MNAQTVIAVRPFLRARILGLAARARRLARIDYNSVGIRPQDLPYVPSPAHFTAANQRLATIDRQIARRLRVVQREWAHSTAAARADRHRPGRARGRSGSPRLRHVLRSLQPARQHLRPRCWRRMT